MSFIGLLRTMERITRPVAKGDAMSEPPLTDAELIGLRGLLQERYQDPSLYPDEYTHFAGAAASLADGVADDVGYSPSVREDKQREAASGRLASVEPVDPHIDAPAGFGTAGSEGQAVPHPPVPACPSPTLKDWLVPAIREVLANHTYDYGDCITIDGRYCATYMPSGPSWEEHVAPLIAERIETALNERVWQGYVAPHMLGLDDA